MAWGIFQTMTVAYAAEVCPVPLRHYLTSYVNLCWLVFNQQIYEFYLCKLDTDATLQDYRPIHLGGCACRARRSTRRVGVSLDLCSGLTMLALRTTPRYKIPFSLQWIWPIPIAIGTYLAPESPWWCVRHGYKERAEKSLKRLARSSGFTQRDADAAMACRSPPITLVYYL